MHATGAKDNVTASRDSLEARQANESQNHVGNGKKDRSSRHPRPGSAPGAARHDVRAAHHGRAERQRRRRVRGRHPRRRRRPSPTRRRRPLRRTVTNSDGFFAFAALPAGDLHRHGRRSPGFNTYEVTGIELRSGDSRSLRQIALKVATVAETVSVSAEVALTPLNSGEKSATLTAEQIENMPDRRHERGRGAAAPARHDPDHAAATPTGRTSPARCTASTATASSRAAAEQPERDRQLRPPTAPAPGPRHHDRRRPRRRPRLQLRDLGQPQHRVRPGVQGPAVELRGRARQGPGRT